MNIAEKLGKMHEMLSEPGVWQKSQYFTTLGGKTCMCVHGASAIVSDPHLSANALNLALAMPIAYRSAQAAAVGIRRRRSYGEISIAAKEAWEERPAHQHEIGFILGMVGLTAFFNDSRPLEDILARLVEAKEIATELGI